MNRSLASNCASVRSGNRWPLNPLRIPVRRITTCTISVGSSSANRRRTLSPSTTAPTGTGISGTHPQTCTLPASQTSTNLGSIGRYVLAFATLATMTSSKRTSGDSAINKAVYPVGDQLAGTMAVDLSEPEPLGPEPLSCEPPPEPPLPPESLAAELPLLCCESLPD